MVVGMKSVTHLSMVISLSFGIMSLTKPFNMVVVMNSWSNENCHFVVMMQNIPQRAIISAHLENSTNLEYFPDLLENFRKILTNLVGKFFQLANISIAEIIYTLKLLRTSMLSWLRTQAATEWLADYWFNTQSQLICIIIAQPHPEPAR